MIFFDGIPLSPTHLLMPTAASDEHANTFAQHDVARGKPVLQTIGEELDTLSFSFFFDEGFCDPGAEKTRLMAAWRSKSPGPLVIPGQLYAGGRFRVERLANTTEATTASGRLVRFSAEIDLIEDAGGAGIGLVSAVISVARAGLAASLRVG